MPKRASAARRASRKPVLFGYLQRWYEPALGLDPWEWTHLEEKGFGASLRRRKLTAKMVVELLRFTTARLDRQAANTNIGITTMVGRMLRILHRHVALTENLAPEHVNADELACLKALAEFETLLNDRYAEHFLGLDSQGRSIYATPPPDILAAFETIQRSFPLLLASVRDAVAAEMFSTDTIKLGRYFPEIQLGEHAAAVAKATALRTELGPRFFDPATPVHQRLSWVQGWKKYALARARRDEEAHAALLEHNRRAKRTGAIQQRLQPHVGS